MGHAIVYVDWIVDDGYAESITEAAYRFCRHTQGIGVALTGTGNIAHLEENLKAIQKGQLDTSAVEKLHKMFEGVDSVSGQ